MYNYYTYCSAEIPFIVYLYLYFSYTDVSGDDRNSNYQIYYVLVFLIENVLDLENLLMGKLFQEDQKQQATPE